MRLARALLIALAVGACTAAPPPAPVSSAANENCIPLSRVAGRHIAGPGAVVFEMIGPVNYRNQLATVCPGMERLNPNAATVSVASSGGSQLCAGDRIRVYDPVEVANLSLESVPTCVLGAFQPVAR